MKKLTVGVLLVLFVISTAFIIASPITSKSSSSKAASARFSKYVWCGKGPDAKTDLMIVASRVGDYEDNLLTGYSIGTDNYKSPIKSFEIRGCGPLYPSGLEVYRDPSRQMLYAAVSGLGISTAGVWVVGIGKSGKPKTLFDNFNRGEPAFRMNNRIPEVRELWEIRRLMTHDWKPTKQFNGHVLVERIYHIGKSGVFELKETRPTIADEKKLSKKEFQRLQQDRRDYESGR